MQTTQLYTKSLSKHVLHVYHGILLLSSSWLLEGKEGHDDYKGHYGGV
jgi:hypothetical protein